MRATLLSLSLGWLALAPVPASAWAPASRLAMANWALRLVPPDLERQIARHERRFQEGVMRVDAERFANRAGLSETIQRQANSVIRSIEGHSPFGDVVSQLGIVAGLVAIANNPLLPASTGAPWPPYTRDYFLYLQGASHRFAVLFYGHQRHIEAASELEALLGRSERRSRALAPMVAREYARIGAIAGVELFDDRSTAFGVGALAFSHGVSDIAGVLRYIWIRAGGIDTRRWPPLDEDHLILVGRGIPGN